MKQHSTEKAEILNYSYWEHFKAAKDLALVLPAEHPKRKGIEKSMQELLEKITKKQNEA